MATFLKNIQTAARSATVFYENKLMEVCDLKGHQAKYILNLCENPGISQDALAKIMFLNKSNVARQVAALEEQGYVERKQGEDKRVSLVYPTEKSMKILPVIRSVNAEWRKVITEGFTEEEQNMVIYLTERLCKNAVKYMEGRVD